MRAAFPTSGAGGFGTSGIADPVPIANGGTGATSAAAARTALVVGYSLFAGTPFTVAYTDYNFAVAAKTIEFGSAFPSPALMPFLKVRAITQFAHPTAANLFLTIGDATDTERLLYGPGPDLLTVVAGTIVTAAFGGASSNYAGSPDWATLKVACRLDTGGVPLLNACTAGELEITPYWYG